MRWQTQEALPILSSTFPDFLAKRQSTEVPSTESCGQSTILHMSRDVYIRRCPLVHCSHSGCAQMLHINSLDFGDTFHVRNEQYEASIDTENHVKIQGQDEFKDIQYRQRAIAYMLKRLGYPSSTDPIRLSTLHDCVINLEKKVYQQSRYKEEYLVTLATKLATILQELKRRRATNK